MAFPSFLLKAVVCPCVYMTFWSMALAEPTVDITLHTKKSNDSFLYFDCETETSPPRVLVQVIDGTVVTVVNESKIVEYFVGMEERSPRVSLKEMDRVRVSKEKRGWNDEEDFACLIDVSIGNFSYQSKFSRKVPLPSSSEDELSKDVVKISPTFMIISENDRMGSGMTFRCQVSFQLKKAVRWSIVSAEQPDVELLDDDLKELSTTKMKVSVESSAMESLLNFVTVDLPPNKYIISCRSRSREDKDLSSASATFEITNVDPFSKYRKLVAALGATSCFFFIANVVTICLLWFTCKKKKDRVRPPPPPNPKTVGRDKQTHGQAQRSHLVTRDNYANSLDSVEHGEDYVNHDQIKHHIGSPVNKRRK